MRGSTFLFLKVWFCLFWHDLHTRTSVHNSRSVLSEGRRQQTIRVVSVLKASQKRTELWRNPAFQNSQVSTIAVCDVKNWNNLEAAATCLFPDPQIVNVLSVASSSGCMKKQFRHIADLTCFFLGEVESSPGMPDDRTCGSLDMYARDGMQVVW